MRRLGQFKQQQKREDALTWQVDSFADNVKHFIFRDAWGVVGQGVPRREALRKVVLTYKQA